MFDPLRQSRGWALCSVPCLGTLPQLHGAEGSAERTSVMEKGVWGALEVDEFRNQQQRASWAPPVCTGSRHAARLVQCLPGAGKSQLHSLDMLCPVKSGGRKWITPPSTHHSLPSPSLSEPGLSNKAFSSQVGNWSPRLQRLRARHRLLLTHQWCCWC